MARDYIARDPKTGRPINRRRAVKQVDIRSMLPHSGVWERIPRRDIVPLASGQVQMVEIPRSEGGGLARRIDGILALNRVLPSMVADAHTALCEALDDDEGVIRIAGLKAMPSFAIKKHDDLFMYLSDRLLEENEHIRKAARECLRKLAPVFPSGCEEILSEEEKETYDVFCLSVGTGGTIAGIIQALKGHKRVLGYSSLKGDFLEEEVRNLFEQFNYQDFSNWTINSDYHFGGYAKKNQQLLTFIDQIEKETELLLDPIYTGKALYGLLDMIQKDEFEKDSKILFIHTGGLQGRLGFGLTH